MTTTNLIPPPVFQAFGTNGAPLAFGKLFSYGAGTVTPIATFTDSTGAIQNTNPIILNAAGQANVWTTPNVAYKFVLQDSSGNQLWAVDQIVNSVLITLFGGVDTGAVNNYLLNFTASFSVLANGIVIYWVPANTNTGASTINVNGLGVVPIVNPDGSALSANQITSGQPLQMMSYNGKWILLNGTFVPGTLTVGTNLVVSGTATITGNLTTSGILTASTTGDNVGKGISVVRFKAVTTARSSNTTITIDPDLQLTLSGGSWQFETLLLFNGTTTGTQGIAFNLRAGGSGPANVNPNTIVQGNVNGSATAISSSGWVVGVAPGWAYATISTSGNDAVMLSGTLIGATAGTYGIGWCQNTTSVNATNLLAGSWMRMVRMA